MKFKIIVKVKMMIKLKNKKIIDKIILNQMQLSLIQIIKINFVIICKAIFKNRFMKNK